MGRRLLPFVLFALVACGSDQDPTLDVPATAAPSTSSRPVTAFDVALSGEGDAAGTAAVRLVPDRSEVCYEIATEGLDEITGAHLHRGTAGESGDAVLDLAPTGEASWEGCAAADQILVQELAANPAGFYVNVHTDAFPDGAIRGQLA